MSKASSAAGRAALFAGTLLALGGAPTPPARAAEATILILAGGLGAQEDRLVEALRIYTGDVEGRLVLAGKAPAALEARVIEQLSSAARKEGADIVVWGGRRADGRPIFYVLDVAERDLRETEIEPVGAERAALDVALKVRALLFHRRARAPDAGAPEAERNPPAPPVAAAAAPPSPPPRAPLALRPPPPMIEAPRVNVRAPVAEPAVFHRYALAAAYGLVLPSEPMWRRQALLLTAEARVGRAPTATVSVFVDGALQTRASGNVRGFTAALADRPLGAGALFTREAGRWAVAVGPRVSLHIFEVQVRDDDGRAGSSTNYAVGLGGALRGEVGLTSYIKVFLDISGEGLVPKQEFKLGGQPAFDTGWTLLGFSGGLRWLLL